MVATDPVAIRRRAISNRPEGQVEGWVPVVHCWERPSMVVMVVVMEVVMVVVGVTEEEEEEISRERGDLGVYAGVQNATKCAERVSLS
jgi:hypothetical protein